MNEELMFKNFSALPEILFNKSLCNVIKEDWLIWGKEYKSNKKFLCDVTCRQHKSYLLENHECYTIDTINKRIIIDEILTLFYPIHKMHHIGYLTTIQKGNLEFIHSYINKYLKTNIDFYNIDKELLKKLYVNYNDVKVIISYFEEEKNKLYDKGYNKEITIEEMYEKIEKLYCLPMKILEKPITRKMTKRDSINYFGLGKTFDIDNYKYDVSKLPNNKILKNALEKKNLLYKGVE